MMLRRNPLLMEAHWTFSIHLPIWSPAWTERAPFFRFAVFLIIFFMPIRSQAGNQDNPDWIAEKWEIIKKADATRDNKAIEELSLLVRGLGKDREKLNTAAQKIFNQANSTLQSIPNYAGYLNERINQITKEEIPAGVSRGQSREFYYEVLQNIRRPEAISVLGSLMADDTDYWRDLDGGDGGRPMPNARLALQALSGSGLNNGPTKGKDTLYPQDLRSWQLWFEQVKAGTRTFSFEGDNRVYSLSGAGQSKMVVGTDSLRSEAPIAAKNSDVVADAKWPLWLSFTLLGGASIFLLLSKKSANAR